MPDLPSTNPGNNYPPGTGAWYYEPTFGQWSSPWDDIYNFGQTFYGGVTEQAPIPGNNISFPPDFGQEITWFVLRACLAASEARIGRTRLGHRLVMTIGGLALSAIVRITCLVASTQEVIALRALLYERDDALALLNRRE